MAVGEGFLVDYQAQLNDRIVKIEQYLGDGKCTNWEEYKKLTGQVRGMRFAIDDMKDILARYQTDEGEVLDESASR